MYRKRHMYVLILSFFLIILILISFGIFQVLRYNQATQLTQQIYKHPYTVMGASKSINTSIIKMHREMKDITLASNHQERLISYEIVNKLEEEVFLKFQIIHKRYLGDKNQAKEVESRFRKWRLIRQEIYDLTMQGQVKKAIHITRNKGARYVASLIKQMNEFVSFADNKALEFLQKSRLQVEHEQNKLIITLVLLLVVILGLIHLVNRHMHKLFNTIQENNTQLQNNNRLLNEAQKVAKMGSWRLDHISNELVWSQETFKIFQLSPQAKPLDYETFLSYIHPDDRKKVDLAYNKAIAEKKAYEVEHRILFKDGSIKYVREKAEITFNNLGDALFSSGTIQDITQEVHEQSAQKTNIRLSQMGEILTMISHQWRQPLNSIATLVSDIKISQMLDSLKPEDLHEKLDKILKQTSGLSEIIVDFQHNFKPYHQAELFSFSNLVTKSLSLSEGSFKNSHIDIDTTIENLVEIYNLKNEILQVILVIYDNAVDALKEAQRPQGKISIKLYQQKDQQVLTICDNAGGIPDDLMHQIFDPYFSTKSKNESGLGLFVSKTIIEKHCHGSLNVENRDNGACFIISLPLENSVTDEKESCSYNL